MGKAAKLRSKVERKKAKQSRRVAMRAQYEAWRNAGANGKRARLRSARRTTVQPYDHPRGHCGNVGCAKCFDTAHAGWRAQKRKGA